MTERYLFIRLQLGLRYLIAAKGLINGELLPTSFAFQPKRTIFDDFSCFSARPTILAGTDYKSGLKEFLGFPPVKRPERA